MSRRVRIAWTRVAIVAAAIAVLELLCRSSVINPLVVLPPSEVVASLWQLLRAGEITGDIVQTFSTVLAAFFLAVVVGFGIGTTVHALPRIRRAFVPLLASYYAVPFFVFYPLFVARFGLNTLPLIAIGFISATPAMMIGTLNGLDRVPDVLRKVARIHRLGRLQTVWRVVLPAALPNLFSGLKLAIAYAFIGVMAGEFILSGGGLGYGIAFAYESFENRTMYALMLFVLLVAIVINGALSAWEGRIAARRGRS